MADDVTPTDFLLARIAEDEAVAKAATPGPWRCIPARDGLPAGIAAGNSVIADADEGTHNADHIARHDPARVLADCEAKRQIVEEHAVDCYVGTGPDGDDDYFCSGCHAPGGSHPDDVKCPTLRSLALPYTDHPDYREEWRP